MASLDSFCLPAPALMREAVAFYETQGRESVPDAVDTLVGMRDGSGIAALVRLCPEFGGQSLRSMQVRGGLQRRGLGSLLLREFIVEVKRREIGEVLCMPYEHLEEFYARVGFVALSPFEVGALPVGWWKRFDKHRNRIPSRPVIMMRWRG